MEHTEQTRCTAFVGMRRIASGLLEEVVLAAREAFDRDGHSSILIFDDVTSEQIDVDLSAAGADLMARFPRAGAAASADDVATGTVPRGPGRPRLGVVAREVTLLPRHWEWLNEQPGGASVALRKLVEVARKANEGRDRQRRAQEAAYRFMSALAGNLPGFEEAIRALFAGDRARFEEMTAPWPPDVRDHASHLAAVAFTEGAE